MELNLMERLMAVQILPKEGSFVTLKITRDLQGVLAPSEAEYKEFEVVQDGEQTKWNEKGREEREVVIGEKATDILVEALKNLDKDKKLTLQFMSLYEKFVNNKQ